MTNRAFLAPNIKKQKKSPALLRQRLTTVITSASSFIQMQRPPRPNKRKNRRIYSSLVSLASPILVRLKRDCCWEYGVLLGIWDTLVNAKLEVFENRKLQSAKFDPSVPGVHTELHQ